MLLWIDRLFPIQPFEFGSRPGHHRFEDGRVNITEVANIQAALAHFMLAELGEQILLCEGRCAINDDLAPTGSKAR